MPNSFMLVSIIIPNYNHEQFLEKRIKSVLNQTYQDFEIIFLDDCSNDRSRDIIEGYRDHPKVSLIIYNEVNSGSTFQQWHKGIHVAKGDLIWIAESDDWCEPEFLETLVAGFRKYPDCVIGYVQSYCMDDEDTVRWHSSHDQEEECVSGEIFFKKRLIYGCPIFNASMAIFKRNFALRVCADFTLYRMCGDWMLWIDMSRFGSIYISGRLLNYFRKSKSSVSSNVYSSGYNYIEELRVIQWVGAQNRLEPGLLKSSIFNKYNNFKRRKKQLSTEDIARIYEAFYDIVGGKVFFLRFIAWMNAKRFINKAGLKGNLLLDRTLKQLQTQQA
jgi:glycosyltransferase involved in cell wall biosynthesis